MDANYDKCLSPNQDLYIEIRNRGNLSVKFIMQYSVNGNFVTKTSSIFHYGQKERLTFPPYALNVCINVLNHSLPNIPLIANVCLQRTETTCYAVIGIPTDVVLVESTC